MPDRAIARRAWRLVVTFDYSRRLPGPPPLQRISKEPGTGEEYPDGAAAYPGGPRHPDNGARLRRQRLSGISANAKGARCFPDTGRAAAVERGVRRPARGDRDIA